MVGAVTPETCTVILQLNKSDCILLHLVGPYLEFNYDARDHELKKKLFKLSLYKVAKLPRSEEIEPSSVTSTLHQILK